MNKIRKLTKFFGCMAIFGFVILILFGYVLFNDDDVYTYSDDDYYNGFDDVDTFFSALMVYFFALIFYTLLLQCVMKHKQKKARKSIESLIKKHSAEFAAQGLRWNLPLAFPHWIELWKDYKVQNSYPQAMIAPQSAFTFTNQPVPSYQYPLPQQVMARNSLTPPTRPLYPTLMSQPLLAQQNETQNATNYVPPRTNDYEN